MAKCNKNHWIAKCRLLCIYIFVCRFFFFRVNSLCHHLGCQPFLFCEIMKICFLHHMLIVNILSQNLLKLDRGDLQLRKNLKMKSLFQTSMLYLIIYASIILTVCLQLKDICPHTTIVRKKCGVLSDRISNLWISQLGYFGCCESRELLILYLYLANTWSHYTFKLYLNNILDECVRWTILKGKFWVLYVSTDASADRACCSTLASFMLTPKESNPKIWMHVKHCFSSAKAITIQELQTLLCVDAAASDDENLYMWCLACPVDIIW